MTTSHLQEQLDHLRHQLDQELGALFYDNRELLLTIDGTWWRLPLSGQPHPDRSLVAAAPASQGAALRTAVKQPDYLDVEGYPLAMPGAAFVLFGPGDCFGVGFEAEAQTGFCPRPRDDQVIRMERDQWRVREVEEQLESIETSHSRE